MAAHVLSLSARVQWLGGILEGCGYGAKITPGIGPQMFSLFPLTRALAILGLRLIFGQPLPCVVPGSDPTSVPSCLKSPESCTARQGREKPETKGPT